jgi:hypothetical protein
MAKHAGKGALRQAVVPGASEGVRKADPTRTPVR